MDPSPKRARHSGEDIEVGSVPLFFFDLSLHAMIENAKNGVCPIEVHKLSPLVTQQIWQKSSLWDIIENICNLGTFELYSNRVIRPQKFTVRNWRMGAGELDERKRCDLYIKFDDGRTLKWTLVDRSEKYFTLHTDLTDAWNSSIAIIEWLTNAFRCKFDKVQSCDGATYFCDLVKWDQFQIERNRRTTSTK
ncbi:unnamed protein product [Caenorhabditis brenneri]